MKQPDRAAVRDRAGIDEHDEADHRGHPRRPDARRHRRGHRRDRDVEHDRDHHERVRQVVRHAEQQRDVAGDEVRERRIQLERRVPGTDRVVPHRRIDARQRRHHVRERCALWSPVTHLPVGRVDEHVPVHGDPDDRDERDHDRVRGARARRPDPPRQVVPALQHADAGAAGEDRERDRARARGRERERDDERAEDELHAGAFDPGGHVGRLVVAAPIASMRPSGPRD